MENGGGSEKISKEKQVYEWQREDMSPAKLHAILDSRREQLLSIIPTKENKEQEPLVQEWLALLVERDNLVQQEFMKENQKMLDRHIKELKRTLVNIGHLSHYNTRTNLKYNLASLYHEVVQYCSDRNIEDSTEEQKVVVAHLPTAPPPPPPGPPPPVVAPPPPPPLPNTPLIKTRRVSFYEKSKRTPTRSRKSTETTPKSSKITTRSSKPNTPLCALNPELKSNIMLGRGKLRSTPGVRSPGGTPVCKKPRRSTSNHSDLMVLALQRKFQNVRRPSSSPTITSPTSAPLPSNTSDLESSFTISID
ncbi:unnamed protein product [Owenia fusiformis]|uniref:Uncharacterized protein n=1 Tax=Owenia fusiformis TaxID=6347 RepID=A0A8S4NN18_OWEFU|nr:unnamed protein product [Owenia fusiformis]